MQKTAFWLLSIIGLIGCNIANAEVTVSVQAIESGVWLQQGDARSKLQPGSQVKPGEIIITGSDGQAKLQLAETTLQISADTEVTFNESNSDQASTTELLINKGRVCMQYRPNPISDDQIKLNIGDTMYVAMSYSGDICASRLDSQSSIELLNGSAQVTHFVDPNLIILSQAGTAFKIEDNGSYELKVPGADEPLISEAIVVEEQKPPAEQSVAIDVEQTALAKPIDANLSSENSLVLENASPAKTVSPEEVVITPEPEVEKIEVIAEKVEDKAAKQGNLSDEMLATIDAYIDNTPEPQEDEQVIELIEIPSPVEAKSKSGGVYTVYLFSTRSLEVAEKANRKFQKAKQNTQIITNNEGVVTRYRVAVTGFTSLKTAQDYASSIVGKLGIEDTWIGKQ